MITVGVIQGGEYAKKGLTLKKPWGSQRFFEQVVIRKFVKN